MSCFLYLFHCFPSTVVFVLDILVFLVFLGVLDVVHFLVAVSGGIFLAIWWRNYDHDLWPDCSRFFAIHQRFVRFVAIVFG